jgi:hypothetical protein
MKFDQEERIEKGYLLRKESEKTLRKKDYLVTIWETGDPLMADGELERMTLPKRYFEVCSLEEIPELIESIGVGHWRHPELRHGMSKKKVAQIPFEERRWGIDYDLHISPLSDECLERFHQYEDSGILNAWRKSIPDEDEDTQTAA